MPHSQQAWGGNRRAWGRSKFRTLILNVIDRYVWDFRYDARDIDANTGNWPGRGGGPVFSSLGSFIGDRSTLFNKDALPERLVDKAVRAGAPSTPNENTFTANLNLSTDSFHYRCLVIPATFSNLSLRLWRYNAPLSFTEFLFLGSNTVIAAGRQGVLGSGPHTIPAGPALFDFTLEGTRMSIYHNGIRVYTGTGGSGTSMQLPEGPGDLTMCEAPGDYLVHAWRFGASFTLAEHQADAARLGV